VSARTRFVGGRTAAGMFWEEDGDAGVVLSYTGHLKEGSGARHKVASELIT